MSGKKDTVLPRQKTADRKDTKRKRQPRYNVVLLDDNDHTYNYVIRMLGRIFAFNEEKAFLLASEVDRAGRAVLMTTTRELAELKQEQIHSFGTDPLIDHCKGSMSAILEPVPDA